MENDQLTQAVESAVAEPAAVSEPTETPAVETPSEPVAETPAEQPAEEPAQPEGPSAEEVQKALGLYNLLNNPETAPQVIQMLGKQLGLIKEPEAPRQKPPTISDIVKSSLGEEYAFLGEKLAPAFEQALNAAIAPIQQQLAQTSIKAEFENARQRLNSKTEGDFGKFESEITKLMDTLRPADGVPIEGYLEHLYTVAKYQKGAAPISRETAKKVVTKIQQTAQERLPSPSAASEPRIVKGPKLPSLEDAIAAALRGERFEG